MTDERFIVSWLAREQRQLEQLELAGIDYYLMQCPACEMMQKVWTPYGTVCRGDPDDPHVATCVRIKVVWRDGR